MTTQNSICKAIPSLSRTQTELFIYKKLIQDYQTTSHDYDTTLIKTVINNESSHFLILLKESKLMTDDKEYLSCYYTIHESKRRYPRLTHYYLTYSKIFPNYNAFREGKYFFMNIQKKQRMINLQERIEREDKQRKTGKSIGIAKEAELFDTELYESIANDTNKEDIDLLFGLSVNDEDDEIDKLGRIINDIDMNSDDTNRTHFILPSKTILRFVNDICNNNNNSYLKHSKENKKIIASPNDRSIIYQYTKERLSHMNSERRELNNSFGNIRQRNNILVNHSITSLIGNHNNSKDCSFMHLNLFNSFTQRTSLSQCKSKIIYFNQQLHKQYMNHSKMLLSRNGDRPLSNKRIKSPFNHQLNSPVIKEENRSLRYIVVQKKNKSLDGYYNEFIYKNHKKVEEKGQRDRSVNANKIIQAQTLYLLQDNKNQPNVKFDRRTGSNDRIGKRISRANYCGINIHLKSSMRMNLLSK